MIFSNRQIPLVSLYNLPLKLKKTIDCSFLDILIEHKKVNGYLKFVTSVCRKPTFSGQCLNFNLINPLSHKLAIVCMLLHHAKCYCNDIDLLD